MKASNSANADQRMPGDSTAADSADSKADERHGAAATKNSGIFQSAIAALGASIFGAGVGEEEELERARKRGMHMDLHDAPRPVNPKAPVAPKRSAEELRRSYREGRPGEASARQADPDAAPTPLQRLHEDGDLN